MELELQDIELCRGGCVDCIFEDLEDCDYLDFVFKTGCGGGWCFRYKEKWEPCTKDNVKVGDVVRIPGFNLKYTITYIYEDRIEFVIKWKNTAKDYIEGAFIIGCYERLIE